MMNERYGKNIEGLLYIYTSHEEGGPRAIEPFLESHSQYDLEASRTLIIEVPI